MKEDNPEAGPVPANHRAAMSTNRTEQCRHEDVGERSSSAGRADPQRPESAIVDVLSLSLWR